MDFMYIFWVVGRVFFQDVTIGSFASSLQPPTHLLLSFFSLFSLFFSLRNHKKNFEKGKKRKMSDKIRDRDMANLKSRGLKWIPDPETQVCMSCKDEFGLLNRRHHCRICGKIFCDKCCNIVKSYPETLKHDDKVRICNACEIRDGKPDDASVPVKTYTVVGYQNCPNHQRVADLLAVLVGKYPQILRGEIVGADSKEEYDAWLADKTSSIGVNHTVSPICFLGTEDDGEYIGDADEFIKYLGERFPNEVGGKRDSGCMIQ